MVKHAEKKTGILLVAFGTSVTEAQKTYGHIESIVSQTFAHVEIRWAFTSAFVRKKLLKAGQHTLSPLSALAQMADEGFTHVAVQSLHVIPGYEYHDLLQIAHTLQNLPKGIVRIEVGAPLLSSHADLQMAARRLVDWSLGFRSSTEALVLMGHGTSHPANVYYPAFQHYLHQIDANVFLGTIEGYPTLDDVTHQLKSQGIGKAWLFPFLTVAGDHAVHDMTGTEDGNWLQQLAKEGIGAHPIMQGLGSIDSVVGIWAMHLEQAMLKL